VAQEIANTVSFPTSYDMSSLSKRGTNGSVANIPSGARASRPDPRSSAQYFEIQAASAP